MRSELHQLSSHSSALTFRHCTCLYVTLNYLNVVAGEDKGRAEPIIPLLSSTLSDSSCSSWDTPRCSCTHLSFLHFPFLVKETVSGTALNSFPHLPFSLWSIQSLTYSPIASHNCTRSLFWSYSAHILMTDFCSRLQDGFLPSLKMPCWFFVITRSPPLCGALLSLINEQGDIL